MEPARAPEVPNPVDVQAHEVGMLTATTPEERPERRPGQHVDPFTGISSRTISRNCSIPASAIA